MYLGNDFEEHAREMETKLWGLWVHKQSDIHHSCESWLHQAYFLAIRKKTQGEKNSKLKTKT